MGQGRRPGAKEGPKEKPPAPGPWVPGPGPRISGGSGVRGTGVRGPGGRGKKQGVGSRGPGGQDFVRTQYAGGKKILKNKIMHTANSKHDSEFVLAPKTI